MLEVKVSPVMDYNQCSDHGDGARDANLVAHSLLRTQWTVWLPQGMGSEIHFRQLRQIFEIALD